MMIWFVFIGARNWVYKRLVTGIESECGLTAGQGRKSHTKQSRAHVTRARKEREKKQEFYLFDAFYA
jgi:hypothetical protein